MQITTRRAGCAATKTRTAAGGHNADEHRRPSSPWCGPSATAPPSPPCHLQLPCRHNTYVTTAATTPFRPPCPLRRAPKAVHHQPRPPTASSAWGGAVARRPLTTILYISIFSLFVYSRHIFITQPLAYCLHKKNINIFTLYCTLLCVISRDVSLIIPTTTR